MAETFDDATYELGPEHVIGDNVHQYIHPACHPRESVVIRFEGRKGQLPTLLRVECLRCCAHVVTLPLAQDGREALVLGKPKERE
jgi:hypothetical protein